MTSLDQVAEYEELIDVESDDRFSDSLLGQSFVEEVKAFTDEDIVDQCIELTFKGDFSYSDDQTSLVYSIDESSPIMEKGLDIVGSTGQDDYETAVSAGLNIGVGFRRAIEQIEERAGADCFLEYEAPKRPRATNVHHQTREFAYKMEEETGLENQGVSAGILAASYFDSN